MNKINLKELTSDTGLLFEIDKEENIYPAEDNITDDAFNLVYSRQDLEKIACLSFDQLIKSMQDISGTGGIYKELKYPGHGSVITETAVVEVHYSGFFEYCDEPFDSSRLREESFKYRIGSGKAIPGWEIALLTMKKGEISWFLIHPEYGFQETGCPPRVPRNATALFEIEVLSVADHISIEDFFLLSEDERHAVTFDSICELIEGHKHEGYAFFKQNYFHKAIQKYKKCLNLLENTHLKSDREEAQYRNLMIAIQLNMALCCLKLSHASRAVTYCRKVLQLDGYNTKAMFRLGQALHQLGDFSEALRNLDRAHRQQPKDQVILNEIQRVKSDRQKFQIIESNMYQKMFTTLTNNEPIHYQKSEKSGPSEEEVSEEFCKSTKDYIREFLEDKDQTECSMPAFSLSEAEMAFLLKTIDDKGLKILQTGSGECSSIKIVKPDRVTVEEYQALLS